MLISINIASFFLFYFLSFYFPGQIFSTENNTLLSTSLDTLLSLPCWSWSEAHIGKYLNSYACNDSTIHTIRADAESACIKCGSDCGGITTDGNGNWDIRQEGPLIDSPNDAEISYLKVSCSDSSSKTIDLSMIGINGTIPKEIASLTQLEYIDLCKDIVFEIQSLYLGKFCYK